VNGTETQLCEYIQQKLVAASTSLDGSKKTNFRLIIYGHDFANHENLAKIGVVVFEISVLLEIAKNRNSSRTHSPPCLVLRSSRAVQNKSF